MFSGEIAEGQHAAVVKKRLGAVLKLDDEKMEVDPVKPESFKMNVAGKEVEVDNRMVPLIGQLISGMVVLIAITLPGNGLVNWAYGISMSVIAMIFALVGIQLVYSNNNKKLGEIVFLGELTYHRANALFLWLWWMIGVGILTFNGKTDQKSLASNMYFSCRA